MNMNRMKGLQYRARSASSGFSIMEILVTLFVLAAGLLGTAALQALALKTNQGGQLRTQAVILGLDILERIEANNPAAVAGKYAVSPLPAAAGKNCYAAPCLPDEFATYGLVQFKNRLEAQLPGATATIVVTGAGPFTYTVQIDWVERITKSSGTTVATTATTTASTESFSYRVSRTYYDRSLAV